MFKNISVEIDETQTAAQSPSRFNANSKKREIKVLVVKFNMENLVEVTTKYKSWIKALSSAKAFTDEASICNIALMIELVKKAWYFGQVLDSEFSKFITAIKMPHFLRLFPYILACFRLENKEMMCTTGFKPLAELCTVVLNQSALQCDIFVPTELLTLAETYYAMPEPPMKIFILDYIRSNKIFFSREFWECYLLWSINRKAKTQDHFERTSVDIFSLRRTAIDTVGAEFRSAILTMSRAGVNKATAQDIVLGMMDKFKLDESNKSLAVAFLQNYSIEKSPVPADAKAKLMLSEYQMS